MKLSLLALFLLAAASSVISTKTRNHEYPHTDILKEAMGEAGNTGGDPPDEFLAYQALVIRASEEIKAAKDALQLNPQVFFVIPGCEQGILIDMDCDVFVSGNLINVSKNDIEQHIVYEIMSLAYNMVLEMEPVDEPTFLQLIAESMQFLVQDGVEYIITIQENGEESHDEE